MSVKEKSREIADGCLIVTFEDGVVVTFSGCKLGDALSQFTLSYDDGALEQCQ